MEELLELGSYASPARVDYPRVQVESTTWLVKFEVEKTYI